VGERVGKEISGLADRRNQADKNFNLLSEGGEKKP
jgi:hypothetical protein